MNIKISDLVVGGQIRTRAIVVQQKTGRPVQFELSADARGSLLAWLDGAEEPSIITCFQAGSTTQTI